MPRKSKQKQEEPVIKQEVIKRNFATNQDVKIKNIPTIIEGYWSNNHVLIRVPEFNNLEKQDENYLKQFNCLTPNSQHSRLYTISESELMRQSEQKRQTPEGFKNRTKSRKQSVTKSVSNRRAR